MQFLKSLVVTQKKKRNTPSDEERLTRFFMWLRHQIPEPPDGWQQKMKPCRWAKILEERKNNLDVSRE